MQYDPDAKMIVVDVKKPKGDRQTDLTNMAYYMEKDVRQSLFELQIQIINGSKTVAFTLFFVSNCLRPDQGAAPV